MKHGDALHVKTGREHFASDSCPEPHTVEEVSAGESYFVCNNGTEHQTQNWETDENITPVSARRIGDFSSYPATRIEYATGASKGMRVTRQDLIPPEALLELGAVYGFGELKYPAGPDGPNWMRGLNYSACVRALKDHISEWELGKDYDDEDGVSPLAHAMWHLCALLTFQARGLGTDDRPFKRVDP